MELKMGDVLPNGNELIAQVSTNGNRIVLCIHWNKIEYVVHLSDNNYETHSGYYTTDFLEAVENFEERS